MSMEHAKLSEVRFSAEACAEELRSRWMKLRKYNEIPIGPFPVLDLFTIYPRIFPFIAMSDRPHPRALLMATASIYNSRKRWGMQHETLIMIYMKDSPEEQRFSIAHEFAHLALDDWLENGCIDPKIYNNSDLKEEFCDQVAREILLPKTLVCWWLKAAGPDINAKTILAGAMFFQVPEYEFQNRLIVLMQKQLFGRQ